MILKIFGLSVLLNNMQLNTRLWWSALARGSVFEGQEILGLIPDDLLPKNRDSCKIAIVSLRSLELVWIPLTF